MSDLPDPLIGHLLRDTWRIESFVARGSMGAVYRGTGIHSGTPVAIKVLNPEFIHDAEIRERFRREATISSRCDSAHIVKVFDLVEDAEGWVCLVMEWLHGETLAGTLKRRGRLGVAEVVAIVQEIGEGLHEAHLAGIVHRDLKPANVFLAEAGRAGLLVPKIVDFGISKILEAGAALTSTATMMGTPHYMPVEQFDNSKAVDQRADIYALGVITYELVAGQRPYRGLTPMAILNQVSTGEPPPLPEDVPEAVARVILRAMAKDADDRYPTVLDYCEALQEAASEAGLAPALVTQPGTQPGTVLGLSAATGALAALPGPPRWRRLFDRHRRVVIGAGAALLGLAVILAAILIVGSVRSCGRPPEGQSGAPQAKLPGLGRLELELGGPGDGARGLATDAHGTVVLGVSAQGGWTRWRLPSGETVARGKPAQKRADVPSAALTADVPSAALTADVTSAALTADGRWQALGTAAGKVLLEAIPGPRMHRLEVGGGGGGGGLSGDSRAVPGKGDPQGRAAGEGSQVTALGFSADGNRLLVGTQRGSLELWDVRSGRRLALLSSGGRAVTAVCLDGDGGKALEGRADGALGYWDLGERRLVLRLPVHRQEVTGVALLPPSPELRAVSASRDGLARFWLLPAGSPGPALGTAGAPVEALAASEDGGLVMTGDAQGAIRLFGSSGRQLAEGAFGRQVTAVAFSKGGAFRLVAGPDIGVRVYRERPAPAAPMEPERGKGK
ncbi:MAG: serine/threonine-protein kinase [Polyangia bacterium]|jgi:hypothetical protein|nr:serine/threonine-protein kinase [Polyangia bacterium]